MDILLPPKAPQWQNYPALIVILQDLRRPLDTESGETILTSTEAAMISACGLVARAGLWRCPLLPDNLVWHIPVLCMLSDLYGPETRGERWHFKRAAVRLFVGPMDALTKFGRRMIRLLQNAPRRCLTRSALKRTLWRAGARFVDFTIDRLIAADFITEYEGRLYPFSKAVFKARLEAQSRSGSGFNISMSSIRNLVQNGPCTKGKKVARTQDPQIHFGKYVCNAKP